MKDGFFRVAAATPKIKVADTGYNREAICRMIEQADDAGAGMLVFPELSLTAYTCGDLFSQFALIRSAREELKKIVEFTEGRQMLIFVGLPWEHAGKLYNAAAAICNGELLGVVPKTNLPNFADAYELRNFAPGMQLPVETDWYGEKIPMGTHLLFACKEIPEFVAAAEICEDLWVPCPPSVQHALAGATVIANCSASSEAVGKQEYIKNLILGQSARLICGYVEANAGEGESTQDVVFGGRDLIAENGTLLGESKRFQTDMVIADLDLERILGERRRNTMYPAHDDGMYYTVEFSLYDGKMMEKQEEKLLRYIDNRPFIPHEESERVKRCEEIFTIQALGLKKRLEHTWTKDVVIGISGGLDSTLALLVAARALDMLDIPRKNIHAVTMPCFGTTDRTYTNACIMTRKLGASLTEVDIKKSVTQHFEDIGHDISIHNVTYENSQARERTQILMDYANDVNAMVIGTGDMSELALGWATYNGDHMSMYGVNGSIPKTLVRHLVRYYADTCGEAELKAVLLDVLDTPVSPELLPPEEDGNIAQKTEDLVGPYELHDFFMYYILRYGYMPSKIYRMAVRAFEGEYSAETIEKWLTVFYRRFFAQQFKRSCLPDGPKVGAVGVSPRGDLRMPSDAVRQVWMDDLEKIHLSA